MRGLKNKLLEEQERLENIIKYQKSQLKKVPEGSLRLSKSHGKFQYYQCTEENKKGKYIARGNENLVRSLAQKSYNERILRLAERRLKQVQNLTKDYDDDEIEKMFLKEHPERQKLIKPIEPTWEMQLKEWKAKEYIGKGFEDNTPVILTEKGERVRSKSERILANCFYRHGIEYKYECPIYLKGMGTVYPDFTFLSPKTREEIYWEHNGKMDDPGYAKKAVRKINAYENNGIYAGEKLILTYETEQNILNTGKIEQLVKRYLIK